MFSIKVIINFSLIIFHNFKIKFTYLLCTSMHVIKELLALFIFEIFGMLNINLLMYKMLLPFFLL